MNDLANTPAKPHFSIVSILAVIAAVVSLRSGAGVGFMMAVIAIVLGVLGFGIALLPGVRGGLVSLVCIFAGALGIVVAIFRLLGHIV